MGLQWGLFYDLPAKLLFFLLKQRSFGVDLAKIKYISMHMCLLTVETSRGGWIANGTKLQGVKSKFWNLSVKSKQLQILGV